MLLVLNHCLAQQHSESESIAVFLFILKTKIVLYMKREMSGMQCIWRKVKKLPVTSMDQPVAAQVPG